MSQHSLLHSKIKRYPYLGNSPNLIDYFLIIGYEIAYIKNKIITTIKKEILSQDKNNISSKIDENIYYNPSEYPDVLTSISSGYSGEMLEEDSIIKFSFPSPPSILIGDLSKEEISRERIVFYVNNDSFKDGLKKMIHGFSYVFYEIHTIDYSQKKYKLFIPKAFTFISQFPFFSTFDNLGNQIYKFFINRDGIEIPLEILLYNIVNFTPSPISSNLNIQFLPTTNISVYAQKVIDITKKQKMDLLLEFEKKTFDSDSLKLDNAKYNTLKALQSLQSSYTNRLKLNQLNVYPYYDFNVSEIFSVLDLHTLIKTFILIFLDQEMLVFSQNLEILNLSLYIITSLTYPFTDSMYLWHIISLRKEELFKRGTEASPYVGKFFSSILGFNCKYDSSIKTDIHYKKPHFIVDLDQKEIHYKKGSDYFLDDSDSENGNAEDKDLKGLNEYESMKLLLNYMQKIFDNKKVYSVFLEKAIRELVNSLMGLAEKVSARECNSSSQRFFNKEHGMTVQNRNVQEAFYGFVLAILRTFYECYTEKGINAIKKKKTIQKKQSVIAFNQFTEASIRSQAISRYANNEEQSKISSENDDSRISGMPSGNPTTNTSNVNITMVSNDGDDVNENPEQKTYYLYYDDKKKVKMFSKEEKIFTNFFKASSKFGTFFKNFIEGDDISELYQIPLMFVEEFLNLTKKKDPNLKDLKYLDILDYFNPQYQNSQLSINICMNDTNEIKPVNANDFFIEYIDFRHFYGYYDLKMKKIIYEESLNYSNISPKKQNVFNFLSTKYTYKSIDLSSGLLQKYDNFLSNFSNEELIQIFPSIEIKQENIIKQINPNEIPNTIEKALIANKLISNQDLIIYSMLNIIGMNINHIQSNKDAEDVEELLTEVKYCMRNYLTMLTYSLYTFTEQKFHSGIKNNINIDISHELTYFQTFFDSLRTSNKIPTKQLKIIAENFDKLEKEFEQALTKYNTENIGEFEMNIKEEETQDKYRKIVNLKLTQCKCEESKQYDDMYFCTITKNVRSKKNISITCEECESDIYPKLEYLSFECDLFSPVKIYEESYNMVHEDGMKINGNQIKKELCLGIILNLIYYATIFPNFKYSACDILLRIFHMLVNKQ